jgi:two-component system chemotaxis response regulator CheY
MLRKILAVDDSALIHQMYKLFLSRYKNCKLVSAMNGLEALDKLGQEEGIDLILLDINMPVMNGLEFLQRLQKEPAYQNIPVIIISTEGKEEDTIRGLKMGAKGYVKKPFQASELHGLIETGSAGPEAPSGSRSSPTPTRGCAGPSRGPDHGLLALERDGLDLEVVSSVLGPLHTLKGNSGMMGFTGIKDYLHRLEDVVGRVRDRGLSLEASLFDILFAGASALRDSVEQASLAGSEGQDLLANARP